MANLYDPVIVYDSSMATYWDSQTILPDTVKVSVAADQCTGSVMEAHWARTVSSGIREDFAMTTHHFSVEAGPGAPMSRLDASDAARVEASFLDKYLGAIGSSIVTEWVLREYSWRHFSAAYPLDHNGFSKPGPVWRLQPAASSGGASSSRMPDQVALTVTYRTASRKHWGRTYQGGWATSSTTGATHGHASTAVVDSLALGAHDWLNDLYDDARKTALWIWSPKYRGALSVNEISVDDTFDVIRSRRAKFPSYRKTYTS